MTLCVAWLRRLKQSNELVMATDSRLTGGEVWDGCPKILALPRTDAAICFAGSTLRTYPLMLQIYTAISSFPDSRKRIMDFGAMGGHSVRVINGMLAAVNHEVVGAEQEFKQELKSSSFLLCGYSWKYSRFRIFKLAYDSHVDRYVYHRVNLSKSHFMFIGDVDKPNGINIPSEAKRRVYSLLRDRGKLEGRNKIVNLDWEPFEILRAIISENVYRTVGGPPQVAKIYRHMNCQQFGVYWPSKEAGSLTLGGRPSLPYEATDWPCIDAATLAISMISLTGNIVE